MSVSTDPSQQQRSHILCWTLACLSVLHSKYTFTTLQNEVILAKTHPDDKMPVAMCALRAHSHICECLSS